LLGLRYGTDFTGLLLSRLLAYFLTGIYISYTWKILKGTGKLKGTTGHGTITGTLDTDPTVPTGIEHRSWKGTVDWKP
jgi:hypothetical protein